MKKTNCMSIIFIMVATIFSAFQCAVYEDENTHTKINFVNWSDKAVHMESHIDHYWEIDPYIVYALNRYYNMEFKNYGGGILMPGKVDYEESDLFDESYESLNDRDSAIFMVFDAERLLEAGYSNSFLVCYMLSREDLMKLHFQVSYPPTEDMRDIYMYPAYDDVTMQRILNETTD